MAPLKNRNWRIKSALKQSGVSQEKLAEGLGISSQAVNERLNKDQEIDSIEFIQKVVDLTGFGRQWIELGFGPEKGWNGNDMVSDNKEEYLAGKNIRPILVTVDRAGRELMTYVPVKAKAGYLRGHSDPQYIEKLPAFSLPNIGDGGTYRMFQVDGESMLQLGGGGLHDGDIVIGTYVEDIFSMRDNRVYVVVSTEGLVIKRVINRLKADGILVLQSDNKNGNHKNIIVQAKEILEVWELKAFISKQLSFGTDLWSMINDLQVEQAKMKEEMKEIKKLKP